MPDDLLIADAERGVALAGIMGGEETEIADATTTVLLEAANFEPYGLYRLVGAAAAAHRGLEPLGEGRRPAPRRPPRPISRRGSCSSSRAGAGRRNRTSTATLPERPVVRYRPERADALIGIDDAARAPAPPARQARLRPRRRRRRRPDLARARRHARGRRDRGDCPLPARGRAEHAAARGARCSAGSRASRRCAAASRTRSSARARRDVHAVLVPAASNPDGIPLPEPMSEHRRPGRGHERRADQDRLRVPHGPHRQVQPALADRGGSGRGGRLSRQDGLGAVPAAG